MERIIEERKSRTALLNLSNNKQPELHAWLTKRAKRYQLPWLLAHTDSGVIWGRLHDDTLLLSTNAFANHFVGVNLGWETLQQCRLFGAFGELLLWQTDQQWQARLRCDQTAAGTAILCLDEEYLLWGTQQENEANGFLLLVEGSQGIKHAPPLKQAPTESRRAALLVRHYLREDPESGQLRISASRLVELQESKDRLCSGSTAVQGGTQ